MGTMSQVVVIMQTDPESMQGTAWFRAVATDEEAAKRWIQDEVDGKHQGGHTYAPGKDADSWINYGTFRLVTVPLQN